MNFVKVKTTYRNNDIFKSHIHDEIDKKTYLIRICVQAWI
jgi:hypothetical protein